MDTEKYIEIQDTIKTGQPFMENAFYSAATSSEHSQPFKRKWVFCKVTSIGFGVGMSAGALMTASAGYVVASLGIAGIPQPQMVEFAASMTVMGLFGAVFSIMRAWVKGLFTLRSPHKISYSIEKHIEKQDLSSIVTVIYPDMANYPASDTYSRDRLASAKLALLSLDPTKTICQ